MNTADMLIYVHPELDADSRTLVSKAIEGRVGVDCAEFDPHTKNHALMVKYDPDAIAGIQILNMVRQTDPRATIVGL